MPARQETLDLLRAEIQAHRNAIPCLPPVLLGVQQALAKNEAGASELARMILADPSLTARVLRMANSSYFGSDHKIRTVTSAILLLGFEAVRNLVLGLSVYDMLSNLPRSFGYRRIWRHSLCCAVCARRFAHKIHYAEPEQAFVAGLLHDLGKLILGQFFASQFTLAFEMARQEGISYCAAEERVLQCTHEEAGRCLADYWCFPDELASVLANHEFDNPAELRSRPALVRLIAVANQVALFLYEDDWRKPPAKVSQLQELCLGTLGIGTESLLEIFAQIKSEVSDCGRLLNITVDEWKFDSSESSAIFPAVTVPAPAGPVDDSRAKLDFLLWSDELAGEKIEFTPFLHETALRLSDILKLNAFLLLVKEPASNCLEAKLGYGTEAAAIQGKVNIHLKTADEAAAAAFLSRKPVALNPKNLHLFSRISESNLVTLLRSFKLAALPILLNGQAVAVLVTGRPQDGAIFDETEIRFLSAYARNVVAVLSRNVNRENEKERKG